MPWVTFVRDFNFRPPEKQNVCIAYKKGMTKFVRMICASQAIQAGKAVQAKRPDAQPEHGDLQKVEARLK